MNRPPLAFDRIADRYDATRGGEERGARTASDIEPWLESGTVLEVGVGTGLVATALRNRGHAVTGVDLSPAMLAHAAQRLGPGRLAVGDARRLPVRAGSVSTVVFVYALHVVGDIPAALAEAARVLRPGGRVVAVHGGASDDPTDIVEAARPLEPLRGPRMDIWDTVREAGSRAGLSTVWHGDTTPLPAQETPRDILDGLHNRLWSWLWDVDEATWQEHVEPAIARLAALPDQDRPRPYLHRHQLSVFAKVN
jgi:SAM-dependent methyltransferase